MNILLLLLLIALSWNFVSCLVSVTFFLKTQACVFAKIFLLGQFNDCSAEHRFYWLCNPDACQIWQKSYSKFSLLKYARKSVALKVTGLSLWIKEGIKVKKNGLKQDSNMSNSFRENLHFFSAPKQNTNELIKIKWQKKDALLSLFDLCAVKVNILHLLNNTCKTTYWIHL